MARVRGFKPIADRRAEILILGSMPGRASLAAGRYYAHPQNAFWRIVCALLRIDPAVPYERKARALRTARVALWDVLQSCTREGSLDAMIERDAQTANDFGRFFRAHRKITRVFFNGATAEACFRRHVFQRIDARSMSYLRLPSTSPANASLSFVRKLDAWRAILRPDRRPGRTAPPRDAKPKRRAAASAVRR